jgi:hypothetical protein
MTTTMTTTTTITAAPTAAAVRRTLPIAVCIAIGVAGARAARAADEADGVARSADAATRVQAAGQAGSFLPLGLAPSREGQPGYVVGSGGYDGAQKTALLAAIADVQLWGPLAIRGGAVYSAREEKLAPTVGAHLRLLTEDQHGVDGSAGVFYKPEGLTEPEGEIESVIAVGLHVRDTYLLANLAYGQDPEGNERDGEVRLALVQPLSARALLGFDSRVRFDLGSAASRLAARGEATLDAVVGPAAALFVDRFALLLHAGWAARRVAGSLATGPFVSAGLGSAF